MILRGNIELGGLLLVLALGAHGGPISVSPDPEVRMMSQAQRQAVQLLTLPDEDYFAFDQARHRAVQSELSNLFGIGPGPASTASLAERLAFVALGAPRQIDSSRHGEFPILIALRYSGQREWESHYQQNMWLVATDLNNGATQIGQLFRSDKRQRTPPPSMTGAPPDPMNARAVHTSVERIDLRRVFVRDWRPGRIAVTVIYYDWKSNTAVVEVQAEDRGVNPLPVGRPSSFLTSIDPSTLLSARVDAVAFVLQASVGGSALVSLAFDLPRADQLVLLDGENNSPVLKANLLLLQLDDKWPVQFELTAPVAVYAAASGEARLRGAVRFDLRTAAERPLAGQYLAYLLAGDRVLGPRPIVLD